LKQKQIFLFFSRLRISWLLFYRRETEAGTGGLLSIVYRLFVFCFPRKIKLSCNKTFVCYNTDTFCSKEKYYLRSSEEDVFRSLLSFREKSSVKQFSLTGNKTFLQIGRLETNKDVLLLAASRRIFKVIHTCGQPVNI
jgi:hypothetical protein